MVAIKRKYTDIIELSLYLFFIIAYPFIFVRYGQDYTDGPFHMMSYVGLRNPSWMTGLQTFIGSLWMRLTGDYVISYRILTRILVWLAMVIPTLVVIGFKKNALGALRCLALSMILFSNLYMYNLSWDTLSYFVIAIIYTLSVVYLYHNESIWLVLIGALTGVLGLIRFPSLAIVLPLFVLIVSHRYRETSKWKRLSLDFLFMSLPLILIYYVLFVWLHKQYPGLLTQADGNSNMGITSAINNIIKSLLPLGYRYVNEGMRVFEILGVLTMLTLGWLNRNKLPKMKPWLVFAMISVLAMYFILTLLRSPYGRHLWLFMASIVLVLLGYLFMKSKIEREHNLFLLCIFSVMIGPVSVIGSDTGLFRLFMGYSFILPIALIHIVRYLDFDMRKGLTLLLCIVAFFSVINKVFFNTVFDDGNLIQLNSEINHQKMKGIKTTNMRKQHIESMLAVADSIQQTDPDSKVLYYGTSSHLMSYLTDTSRPPLFGWRMDFQDIKSLRTHVVSDLSPVYVFCVTGYPERDFKYDSNGVEDMLTDNGYAKIKDGNKYFVYKKIDY